MTINNEFQSVGNNVSPLSDKSEDVSSYFFVVVFLTIAVGLLKGLLGLFWIREVGVWGLDYLIISPPHLTKYHEVDLLKHKVIYDEYGWPVHPITGKRHVRILSPCAEVSLNSVLFLLIPVVMAYRGLQKLFMLCCMCCSPEDGEDDDKLLLPKYDCKCEYTKKTEEIDTLFVIKELERSKESLASAKNERIIQSMSFESGGELSNFKSKMQPQHVSIQTDISQETFADDGKSIIPNGEKTTDGRSVAYLTVFEREASVSGAVGLRPSQKYCVRGYTTSLQDGGVKFSPAVSMWQYWAPNSDGNRDMIRLDTPQRLNAKNFVVNYESNDDMKTNGRVLLFPQYPCLNVRHQGSVHWRYAVQDYMTCVPYMHKKTRHRIVDDFASM